MAVTFAKEFSMLGVEGLVQTDFPVTQSIGLVDRRGSAPGLGSPKGQKINIQGICEGTHSVVLLSAILKVLLTSGATQGLQGAKGVMFERLIIGHGPFSRWETVCRMAQRKSVRESASQQQSCH